MKKAIFLAACAVALSASAEVPLKVYSGVNDTIAAEHTVVTVVTVPNATAKINGNPVDVTSTGCFAADVALAEGTNPIDIEVMLGGETASRHFDVVRVAKPAQAAKDQSPKTEQVYPTPFAVETTDGAYLQYGNGGDRLGGSKMGFVAAGIPLKVTGRSGDLYKVALSANRYAYVPVEYTKPTAQNVQTVNTGSWSVNRLDGYDRVSVSLPARLPYRYYTLIDPSTIIIELYGATDNSNWITQRQIDLGMVDYVDLNQPESDVYQVIIHLKHKYQWGFTVDYQGSSLIIDVRHTPADLSFKGLVIGLDAGHGGEYSGAVSPSGLKEKDVNLDIVLRLRDLLEKSGAKVVLTRDSDTGPSMAERKRILREGHVDLAVSVHNNAGGTSLSSPGTSTYYKHLFDRPLAEMILRRLLETGLPNYGLTGNFNFSLNGPTDYPNALAECAFMSSLHEEALLATPEFRQKLAEEIYRGLQDYLNAVKKSLK